MNLSQRIWRSSLGKKYLMALSGLALFGFVVGHLLGNLQIFGKPELINSYAHFLKSKPGLLWGARLGLLAMVGLHVAAALGLSAANRAARPVGYSGGGAYGSSWQSRYMLVSGLVVLAFVVYHLLHFTAQLPALNGGLDVRSLTALLADGTQVQDVYAMMIHGFRKGWVALFYLLAQALLFVHLSHGLASLFQSLGLRNHVWWPRIAAFAKVASFVVFLGFASIPVAILTGMVGGTVAHAPKASITATETLR